MSKQQERQNAVRLLTGTAYNYADDWHALFDQDGVAEGPFNERLRTWINDTLGTSYQNVNDAMRMFAIDQGFTRWSEMGDFSVGARILLSADHVTEDTEAGDLIGTLSVTGGSGSYTFSITADPDSKFAIDGVDDTRLEAADTFNYDVEATHTVTIQAAGTGGPFTRTFTIYVTNPNPVFTSAADQTIAENEPFSLTLTTRNPATFSIVGGADADLFDLDTDAVEASAFDYELPLDANADNVYEFVVRATDVAEPALTTDLAMTLTVNNVAEGGGGASGTFATSPISATSVLSNANRNHTTNASDTWATARSSTGRASGKYYAELTVVATDEAEAGFQIGICDVAFDHSSTPSYLGQASPSVGFNDFGGGLVLANGFTNLGASFASHNAGDVFGIAVDVTNKKAWFSKNGTYFRGDPSTDTDPSVTWSGSYTIHIAAGAYRPAAILQITTSGVVGPLPTGFSEWE